MSRNSPRVAVIGGGFAGIATAVKLKRAGIETFTVFEQSDGPGGTWWDNRYPGCEVDIPSHAYSFSFMTYDWSGTHAKQEELARYASDVVERFGLANHFRLGTRVTAARFDDATGRYRVELGGGEVAEFEAVISCLGLLNVPQYPRWPGLSDFTGPVFHTSRWEAEHDLRGKRVALVGTGSTGVQVAPAIAPIVDQLYIFQREPGWILPKAERDFSERERELYRRFPLLQKLDRARLFAKAERRVKAFDVRSRLQQEYLETCRRFIEEAIEDEEVRRAVTPDYPWGCKRPVNASTFYGCLNRPNVTLVPHAVDRVTPTGVIDATGVEREVDAIILATGFQPTRFLATLEVTGVGGISLHEVWGEDPRAFLGITVSGFPNFFMCYGPNTNGGWSIIAQLERQAEVAVRAIRHLRRPGSVIDTRPGAMRRYTEWIDHAIRTHASAMESGCRNYYHSASGRNVTQWPFSHAPYYAMTKLLPPLAFTRRAQLPPSFSSNQASDQQEKETVHDAAR